MILHFRSDIVPGLVLGEEGVVTVSLLNGPKKEIERHYFTVEAAEFLASLLLIAAIEAKEEGVKKNSH